MHNARFDAQRAPVRRIPGALVKFHLSTAEGNVVTGTGPGWVRVGADEHRESHVLAPDTIVKPWAATFEALDE
jgi:hypothetical protein